MIFKNGLSKLTEECGELIQVASKKILLDELEREEDWDGNIINERIEEEMADVMASINFVMDKLMLNKKRIARRVEEKMRNYEEWEKSEDTIV